MQLIVVPLGMFVSCLICVNLDAGHSEQTVAEFELKAVRRVSMFRSCTHLTVSSLPKSALAMGVLGLLLAAASVATASAQQPTGAYYGPHMWDVGWWMFFGPLTMILSMAAIIIVVVLIVRWLGGLGHAVAPHGPPGKTPLDILKERFARGEIDKAEFDERRRVLEE
jgi:putative membrane protein